MAPMKENTRFSTEKTRCGMEAPLIKSINNNTIHTTSEVDKKNNHDF